MQLLWKVAKELQGVLSVHVNIHQGRGQSGLFAQFIPMPMKYLAKA